MSVNKRVNETLSKYIAYKKNSSNVGLISLFMGISLPQIELFLSLLKSDSIFLELESIYNLLLPGFYQVFHFLTFLEISICLYASAPLSSPH